MLPPEYRESILMNFFKGGNANMEQDDRFGSMLVNLEKYFLVFCIILYSGWVSCHTKGRKLIC